MFVHINFQGVKNNDKWKDQTNWTLSHIVNMFTNQCNSSDVFTDRRRCSITYDANFLNQVDDLAHTLWPHI